MSTNHEPGFVEGLEADVRSDARAGHGGRLPAELTSFVGRRRELAEVKRLLGESRSVTLTGVGGVGKTRLAQQVAGHARRAFPDGVWFVDLTAVRDPALLTQEVHDPGLLAHLVGIELGLRERSPVPPLDLLTGYLAARSVLLVLDNCEHLVPACSVLADALLRSCPRLRILATGREPLGIGGETLFAVPPMPVPDPEPGAAELAACESVALFVARAETARPWFRLTEENRAAVAGICRRLDGLPLALELAASWLPVLAPGQILDRLADRFALLHRGARSAPDRQQTLRACVSWSYELCSKPERLLWARMSVFVGGCEIDAIEGVCTDERLPEADLLDVLAGLVDKSILSRDDQGQITRYRMLETLRDYGREMLIESGDYDALRRRHRDWYQRLVARAHAEWISDQQVHWLARLHREQSHLRAAVEFSLTEPGEAEAALAIAVSLPWLYWFGRGVFGEGRRWLDLALAQTPARTGLRARALLLDSFLAFAQGDVEAGARLLEQGEQLADELEDPAPRDHAALIRGIAALWAGDLPSVVKILEHAPATSGAQERDPELRLQVLIAVGGAAALAGDHERALACAREILAITEPTGEAFSRAYAMWTLGFVTWRRGNLDEAASYGRTCLQLGRETGFEDRFATARAVEMLAWINADQQRYRRAATLLGAAEAMFTDLGTPITSSGPLIGLHQVCEQDTRRIIGDAPFQDAFSHGRALTLNDAVAYALEESRATPQAATKIVTPLTRREREVAELVARGLSNKDIATQLVISQRTAEGHVERILTKLAFTSRAQIAAWIASTRNGSARS